MANMKEIQTRINSVMDTMKITNAMYMISSSKMQQARKKLADTEPYFYGLQGEIARILRHVPDLDHKYFSEKENVAPEDKKIGTLIITGDKGLAGAYNHNVIKIAEGILSQPGHHKLFVIGEMGRHYFTRKKVDIDENFRYTVQKPTMHSSRAISNKILNLFNEGELDEVYVVYTRMENSLTCEAQKERILPLEHKAFNEMKMPLNMYREEIELYPDAKSVLDMIVPNYVTGFIYGSLVESYSSEHNARMMAMQSATDSAKDIIKDLSIEYNRARQAAITQELTEVVSGAKAQNQRRK